MLTLYTHIHPLYTPILILYPVQFTPLLTLNTLTHYVYNGIPSKPLYTLYTPNTPSFGQRLFREGVQGVAQLQLAPSLEHQIAAMFSILVRWGTATGSNIQYILHILC